jgi:hypothetical protein
MKIPQYSRTQDLNPASLPMANPEALTSDLTAARKFGAELTEFGASENRQNIIRQQEIQKENEEAIAQTTLHQFKLAGIEALKGASQVQGEEAVETAGKPGITREYQKKREEAKLSVLEGFKGSDKIKNALSHALNMVLEGETAQVAHHEASQGLAVKKQAIESIFDDSIRSIAAGGTLEAGVERMNRAVDAYSGGSAAEKLLYRSKLELAYQKTAKDRLTTDTLIKLKNEFPDVQKRIEHIESPEFIKSLGTEGGEISNTLMSYTLREWKTQEDAYKTFADNKVGEISEKIYNHKPYTPAELAGLRPPERALVERLNDYQIRQDRAELASQRAERSAERAEERNRLYEIRIQKQEKSDSIEGDITAKIINGDPLDIKTDIYGKIPDGLSAAAANRLVGMVGKTQKDPAYKLGLDVINKTVGLDAATRGRMIIDFKTQVDEEKATGKRIIEIAEGLAAPKKKNAIAEWLDGVWGSAKEHYNAELPGGRNNPMGTTGLVGPTQEDLEFTAKKHGISVDEVKKRMGIQ